MKKVLTLVLILACICALVSCGDKECEHDWQLTASSATCTEDGQAVYTCSKCNAVETRDAKATGHTLVESIVDAGCTTVGYTLHSCANCEYSFKDNYKEALGHNYVGGVCEHCHAAELVEHTHEYVYDATLSTAADCTHVGIKISVCSCGEQLEEAVAATGHDYQCENVKADCEHDGYDLYTCSKCQDSYKTNLVAANGHQYSEYVMTEAPTCNKEGKATATCSVCQATTSKVLDKSTVHNYDDGKVTKAATCSTEGVKTFTCQDCGTTKTEIVAKTAHNYGEVVEGISTCSVCQNTKQVVGNKESSNVKINASTVSSANGNDQVKDLEVELKDVAITIDPETLAQFANADGDLSLNAEPLTAESPILQAATQNLDAGDKVQLDGAVIFNFSASVGDSAISNFDGGLTIAIPYTLKEGEDANKLAVWYIADTGLEKIEKVSYDATAQEIRFTTTHFSGYAANEEETDCNVIGHDYVETVVAPTCTELGYTVFTCSRCQDTKIDKYVQAQGHAYDNGVVTKKATCTEKGVKLHTCSRCDATYEEAILAVGHSITELASQAATCTEAGLTAGSKCSTCGEVFVEQKTIQPLGHDYTSKITKAATGDENGNVTYTCTRCGYTYDEIIPASGVTYDEGKVTKAATCTEDGVKTFTSTNTSTVKTYTEVIPAKGHDLIHHDAVAATCSTVGNNEYYTCSRCDYSTKVEIPMIEHDYAVSIKNPTCTEAGSYTYTCTLCGHSYSETIAAKGHTDDNGDEYCDNCRKYLGNGFKVQIVVNTYTDKSFSEDSYKDNLTIPTLYFIDWDGTNTKEEAVLAQAAKISEYLTSIGYAVDKTTVSFKDGIVNIKAFVQEYKIIVTGGMSQTMSFTTKEAYEEYLATMEQSIPTIEKNGYVVTKEQKDEYTTIYNVVVPDYSTRLIVDLDGEEQIYNFDSQEARDAKAEELKKQYNYMVDFRTVKVDYVCFVMEDTTSKLVTLTVYTVHPEFVIFSYVFDEFSYDMADSQEEFDQKIAEFDSYKEKGYSVVLSKHEFGYTIVTVSEGIDVPVEPSVYRIIASVNGQESSMEFETKEEFENYLSQFEKVLPQYESQGYVVEQNRTDEYTLIITISAPDYSKTLTVVLDGKEEVYEFASKEERDERAEELKVRYNYMVDYRYNKVDYICTVQTDSTTGLIRLNVTTIVPELVIISYIFDEVHYEMASSYEEYDRAISEFDTYRDSGFNVTIDKNDLGYTVVRVTKDEETDVDVDYETYIIEVIIKGEVFHKEECSKDELNTLLNTLVDQVQNMGYETKVITEENHITIYGTNREDTTSDLDDSGSY